ncbi:hypothetical protein GCM10027046_39080 [Uliginosibacterium flavum]|uniref:N-methyl-D-aspartate receptor NMDAR2C subunit n=1 Tax=Uliginosibacterium flavum TaxID=1396831 RepID=A0ABV2TKR4_9RHOO
MNISTPQTAWEKFWAASGAAQACPQLMTELLLAWSEPQRHYHTLRHLVECLDALEGVWPLAERPAELCLALWFHDAIYDVRARDNEARSADWARRALLEGGFPAEAAQRVHDLVMATCHNAQTLAGDAALLVDIDLAILGAPPTRFDEYETQVRAEYAWVPEAVFRSKRREVLQGFLARPNIYYTPHFRQRFEEAARANLCRSISNL